MAPHWSAMSMPWRSILQPWGTKPPNLTGSLLLGNGASVLAETGLSPTRSLIFPEPQRMPTGEPDSLSV